MWSNLSGLNADMTNHINWVTVRVKESLAAEDVVGQLAGCQSTDERAINPKIDTRYLMGIVSIPNIKTRAVSDK